MMKMKTLNGEITYSAFQLDITETARISVDRFLDVHMNDFEFRECFDDISTGHTGNSFQIDEVLRGLQQFNIHPYL